jgi:predicted nucleotidyltransferase
MKNKITKEKVLNEIASNKKAIKNMGVKSIGLFGSVLKDKQNNKSDIDLVVSFDNYTELLMLLEKILKRKIDLVTEASLRPELLYIKKEAEYILV